MYSIIVHLYSFQFGAIENSAIMNILVHVF